MSHAASELAKELERRVAADFATASDPYPDLPTIPESELRDGDVLLMLGEGWAKIHGVPIPVSWLIRLLDGGAYSHGAVVTREAGEPRVWDHSTGGDAETIGRLAPVPLASALKEHAYCHVYRFFKNGEPLDGPDYPSGAVTAALRGHRGDPYDMTLLAMAGIVALISRIPDDAVLRAVLRFALGQLASALEWLIAHVDVRRGALVCTAVVGVSFWDSAPEDPSHRFALEADLERRRSGAAPLADPEWEALLARIRRALAQLWTSLPAELAARASALASNALWVEIGGPSLAVNLVAPSDLENSRTLRRVAKLAIPKS